MSWARLLKRVFEIDLEDCPNCGGELKIIAAILEAPVIERIPNHRGLQARAPPRAPALGQTLLQAACSSGLTRRRPHGRAFAAGFTAAQRAAVASKGRTGSVECRAWPSLAEPRAGKGRLKFGSSGQFVGVYRSSI